MDGKPNESSCLVENAIKGCDVPSLRSRFQLSSLSSAQRRESDTNGCQFGRNSSSQPQIHHPGGVEATCSSSNQPLGGGSLAPVSVITGEHVDESGEAVLEVEAESAPESS